MRPRFPAIAIVALFLLLMTVPHPAFGQQGAASGAPLVVRTITIPKGYLQRPYRFALHADGGITPLKWRMINGSLPPGIALGSEGILIGIPTKTGDFSFSVTLTDSGIPAQQISQHFTLLVMTPLIVRWSRPPKVSGQRVEGAIKVSNQTGEDFDLTMVALAVNENGRATAIGYQHFPLKQNTIDFEIPFGENLPYGAYSVNIDVVAEVAASNSIFRGRLVTRVRVLQGP